MLEEMCVWHPICPFVLGMVCAEISRGIIGMYWKDKYARVLIVWCGLVLGAFWFQLSIGVRVDFVKVLALLYGCVLWIVKVALIVLSTPVLMNIMLTLMISVYVTSKRFS